MRCRHCEARLTSPGGRGRGLCPRCFDDEAVRESYPQQKRGPKPGTVYKPRAEETEPTEEELNAMIAEQSKPENLPHWWAEAERQQREKEAGPKLYRLVRRT